MLLGLEFLRMSTRRIKMKRNREKKSNSMKYPTDSYMRKKFRTLTSYI